MNRAFLKFCVALLATMMVVVPFAGLDSLPRSLRAQIDSERSSLAAAQQQVRSSGDAVSRDLAAEPELFRGVPAAAQWPVQLAAASADLQNASRGVEQLTTLERQNRRQDRERVEQLLATDPGAAQLGLREGRRHPKRCRSLGGSEAPPAGRAGADGSGLSRHPGVRFRAAHGDAAESGNRLAR